MPDQSAASPEDSEGLGRTFASIMLGQLGRGPVPDSVPDSVADLDGGA